MCIRDRDFTVTLPPGSNFLPPNRPEQPEPDDEDRIVTLQIPITKVVELGGNTAPKQTTFSFYAFPSDPSYGRYEAGGSGLWDVQNCTVTVNGAGTFSLSLIHICSAKSWKSRSSSPKIRTRFPNCGGWYNRFCCAG